MATVGVVVVRLALEIWVLRIGVAYGNKITPFSIEIIWRCTSGSVVELIFNAALVCKRSSVRWFLLEKEGYFPTHFDYPLVLLSKVCVRYIESFDLL